jgi:hypothetical protein
MLEISYKYQYVLEKDGEDQQTDRVKKCLGGKKYPTYKKKKKA